MAKHTVELGTNNLEQTVAISDFICFLGRPSKSSSSGSVLERKSSAVVTPPLSNADKMVGSTRRRFSGFPVVFVSRSECCSGGLLSIFPQ